MIPTWEDSLEEVFLWDRLYDPKGGAKKAVEHCKEVPIRGFAADDVIFSTRWWFCAPSLASSRPSLAATGWMRRRQMDWSRGSSTRWCLSGRRDWKVGGGAWSQQRPGCQTTGYSCFSIFFWKGKGPQGSSVLQGTSHTELCSWHGGWYSSSPKFIRCCDGLAVELNGRTELSECTGHSLGGVYSFPYLKLTNWLSPGDTDVKSRLWDAVGEGEGGMIWENNIETYTLYVK